MSGPQKLPDEGSVLLQRADLHLEGTGPPAGIAADPAATLSLLEETLDVSKRQVVQGTVRVSTRTETYDEVAEVTLDHDVVEVTRVAIGQVVEVAPDLRTEGDTTIVPVVEERLVIVKQLYLKEELHIRRRVEQEVSQITVPLRRQTAVVERFSSGDAADGPSPSSKSTSADPAST